MTILYVAQSKNKNIAFFRQNKLGNAICEIKPLTKNHLMGLLWLKLLYHKWIPIGTGKMSDLLALGKTECSPWVFCRVLKHVLHCWHYNLREHSPAGPSPTGRKVGMGVSLLDLFLGYPPSPPFSEGEPCPVSWCLSFLERPMLRTFSQLLTKSQNLSMSSFSYYLDKFMPNIVALEATCRDYLCQGCLHSEGPCRRESSWIGWLVASRDRKSEKIGKEGGTSGLPE